MVTDIVLVKRMDGVHLGQSRVGDRRDLIHIRSFCVLRCLEGFAHFSVDALLSLKLLHYELQLMDLHQDLLLLDHLLFRIYLNLTQLLRWPFASFFPDTHLVLA